MIKRIKKRLRFEWLKFKVDVGSPFRPVDGVLYQSVRRPTYSDLTLDEKIVHHTVLGTLGSKHDEKVAAFLRSKKND